MRLIVARNIEKNEWNIDKLLCTFKLELEARERCNTLSESSSPKPFENRVRHKGKLPYSSSTLFSGKALHLYHTVVIVRSNIHQLPVPL